MMGPIAFSGNIRLKLLPCQTPTYQKAHEQRHVDAVEHHVTSGRDPDQEQSMNDARAHDAAEGVAG